MLPTGCSTCRFGQGGGGWDSEQAASSSCARELGPRLAHLQEVGLSQTRSLSHSGSGSGSGSNTVIIGAAAGAAAGVVLVAFGAWKASKKCNAPTEPLTEVVSAGVLEQGSAKDRIESLLFYQQGQ
mmetsp:Transcript_22578/g.53531  ORF Transcript_22578/g.53531 Transcript_22578/m.53531 type:complete len:126 (+) Transcript_22578:1097-1474(+)